MRSTAMPMLTLTTELRAVLVHALHQYRDMVSGIDSRLATRFHVPISSTRELMHAINEMIGAVQTGATEIDEDKQALAKRAIMYDRLRTQRELESRSELTHNAAVLAELERRITPINQVVVQPWFAATTADPMPRLTDYLNLEEVEAINNADGGFARLIARVFDEKFHILQAPGLLLPDMEFYRNMCEMRSQSLVVAFIDIDEFKLFNDQYGHETVDQEILPPFMRTLEAYVYSHGTAYRFGGDEYKLLLPNTNEKHAVSFLAGLQESLASVKYGAIGDSKTPEVSIGICELESDSVFTDKEVINFAERAATEAKTAGRNRICATHFSGTTDPVFEVVWPAPD